MPPRPRSRSDHLLRPGVHYTASDAVVSDYAATWPQVAQAGVFAEPYSAEKRATRVDYRDVAEVEAIALTEDRLLYGTFELGADGNLNRHDVAAIMGEVLGREIRAEKALFKAWADEVGLTKGGTVRPGLRAMYDWNDAHGILGIR
jgi:uncharacterized protein YbjT (DUF2867 family)